MRFASCPPEVSLGCETRDFRLALPGNAKKRRRRTLSSYERTEATVVVLALGPTHSRWEWGVCAPNSHGAQAAHILYLLSFPLFCMSCCCWATWALQLFRRGAENSAAHLPDCFPLSCTLLVLWVLHSLLFADREQQTIYCCSE